MSWPQWIMLALFLAVLLAAANLHDRPRTGKYSLPATMTAVLLEIALLYAGGFFTPAHAAELPPPAAARYQRLLVRQAHMEWGLDAPIAAMAAQVEQESAWNPRAVSRAGARGLAQFMPATAAWWCEKISLSVTACQPHNPAWALRALAGYDKFLYGRVSARFGPFDRMWLALRGYNGGEGHITAEAAATGLAAPTRQQIDAACGRARRAKLHCAENLGYPARILLTLQPRYAAWGPQVLPATEAAR